MTACTIYVGASLRSDTIDPIRITMDSGVRAKLEDFDAEAWAVVLASVQDITD